MTAPIESPPPTERISRVRRPPGGRTQLSDEVAAHLRMAIMSGALRPGTFVRLDDTAAELGVSVMPVREALRTLRGEGLVQLEPHRGHVVSPVSREDVSDLFWLQATVAVKLVRSASQRIGVDQIDELERLTAALSAAVDAHAADEVAAHEFAFHRALNGAADRTKLAWFLGHLTSYIPATVYATSNEWCASTVANHRALVEALRGRDVETAVRLTIAQFAACEQLLTARFDALGLWS